MRIGIDFDNTIACYDGVFHRAALERGLIPPGLPADKTSVRNHLRGIGREDAWTELQGYVYGARMDLVACYPGAVEFMRRARVAGHTVLIISHKTRHPYLGPRHDLHQAAREFLQAQGLLGGSSACVDAHACRFELTLAEKLARIAAECCDIFIDDLPEFLAEPAFPAGTRAILFDPDNHYAGDGRFARYRSWLDMSEALLPAAVTP
jgi:hypothetical protein